MREATITGVRPFGLFSTVITFDAVDNETGEELVVGVDHRPARELRAALEDGEEPVVALEEWQIVGRCGVRFTRSRDGSKRATIRVTHRVSLVDLATVLALEVGEDADATEDYGRGGVEKLVREYLDIHGHDDLRFADYDEDSFEVAVERVKALFPEAV